MVAVHPCFNAMSEKGGIRDPVKKLASTKKEKYLGAFETYGYAEYKRNTT